MKFIDNYSHALRNLVYFWHTEGDGSEHGQPWGPLLATFEPWNHLSRVQESYWGRCRSRMPASTGIGSIRDLYWTGLREFKEVEERLKGHNPSKPSPDAPKYCNRKRWRKDEGKDEGKKALKERLFVVCCLLFVVSCLLCVVCCVLCSLFCVVCCVCCVCCVLCVVCCVCCVLCVVCCLLCVVCCVLLLLYSFRMLYIC